MSGAGTIPTQYGLFDALTIAIGRSSLDIEDATTFANVVVLYIEMQQSNVRADS
jgi:hypothetical protein